MKQETSEVRNDNSMLYTRKAVLIGILLLFYVGFDQGALFYYRLKPAVTVLSLFYAVPQISILQVSLVSSLAVFSTFTIFLVLSFASLKLLGSKISFANNFIVLSNSLYPWLLGIIPLIIVTLGGVNSFIPFDNLTKIVAIIFSFYLWYKNIKMTSGLASNGQVVASIILTFGMFIIVNTVLLFAVVMIAGASLI